MNVSPTCRLLSLSLGLFLGGFVTGSLPGCTSNPDEDIRDISLEIDFQRTDQMMQACALYLKENPGADYYATYDRFLKAEGDFFYEMLGGLEMLRGRRLSEAEQDSLLANNLIPLLSDSIIQMLLDTVQRVFPADFPFEQRLEKPLKRLKKHFPDIELPAFRTHVNGFVAAGTINSVDQIVPLPAHFSFGLHYFLGRDFSYPPNIPKYICNRFASEYLEVNMAHEVATGMVAPLPRDRQPNLIELMVYEGIKLYFVQQMLPHTPDSLRFYYTTSQMQWANRYEQNIYKELLPHFYSDDFKAQRDYLTEKPYTTQISPESAPRIGAFLGARIVENYMRRHPEVSLETLSEMTDYTSIFKAAKYKP